MPTYRSITIALHSQFDMAPIPEYSPPPSLAPTSPTPTSPTPLINNTTSTCTVYMPTLPGSQFWIKYAVSPPVPAAHFFLFKLYVDGVHVLSWGTGREEKWRGKTVFGLFDAGGGRGVEKRVFCFGARGGREGHVGGAVEVRVFRAGGRKRVEREVRGCGASGLGDGHGGVRLVYAGRAGAEMPKRFYRFGLVDPVDRPFATFRFCYRTWEQLSRLGLLGGVGSEGSELPVIEPDDGGMNGDGEMNDDGINGDSSMDGDASTNSNSSKDVSKTANDGTSTHDLGAENYTQKPGNANKYTLSPSQSSVDTNPRSPHKSSSTYIPLGAPSSISTGSPISLRRRGRLNTHRLSVPPSIKFDAPESASQPLSLPQKNDSSSTAYRPHPAYPVEEWTVRTRSPVRSAREGVTMPLLERRGLRIAGAGLMGVITSTWKRSLSSAQAKRKAEVEVDEEMRSVSY